MRFCGENILTFTSLEKLEKRTKDFQPPDIEADLQRSIHPQWFGTFLTLSLSSLSVCVVSQDAIDQALHDEEQEQNVIIDASRIPV
uniref:Uncharacterized protein n=1 Tax=Parascaris equorum TaxID=6256 RepID=A0A914R4G6_PAREQ